MRLLSSLALAAPLLSLQALAFAEGSLGASRLAARGPGSLPPACTALFDSPGGFCRFNPDGTLVEPEGQCVKNAIAACEVDFEALRETLEKLKHDQSDDSVKAFAAEYTKLFGALRVIFHANDEYLLDKMQDPTFLEYQKANSVARVLKDNFKGFTEVSEYFTEEFFKSNPPFDSRFLNLMAEGTQKRSVDTSDLRLIESRAELTHVFDGPVGKVALVMVAVLFSCMEMPFRAWEKAFKKREDKNRRH